MIEAILDWIAENLSARNDLRIVDTRYMDDMSLNELELTEASFGDAAACAACDGYNLDSDIPIGKQVI